jgi:hypothetical protein
MSDEQKNNRPKVPARKIGRVFAGAILIFLFALLLQHRVMGDAIDATLTRLPQLAPDNCALQSPDALLNTLLAMEPKPEGVGSCEACIDNFYDAYAQQLAKKTDADFPAAKKFRPAFRASLETCFEYLAAVHHHNGTKHYSDRIAGQAEWIIFCGAKQKYTGYADFGGNDIMARAWVDDDSNYTPKLIEQIGIAIGRANAGSRLDHFEGDMLPILRRSLEHLAEAEQPLTDDQKPWFRRYYVLFMTRFP